MYCCHNSRPNKPLVVLHHCMFLVPMYEISETYSFTFFIAYCTARSEIIVMVL